VVGVLFVGYDLAIGGGVSDYDFWLTMPTHQSRWLFRLTSCVGSAGDGGLGDIAEVGSAISNEEWQTGDVVAKGPEFADGSVDSTPAKWLCLGEAKQTDSESDGWLEELHVGCSERVMRSVEKVCGCLFDSPGWTLYLSFPREWSKWRMLRMIKNEHTRTKRTIWATHARPRNSANKLVLVVATHPV
jgi:hypothetical protein